MSLDREIGTWRYSFDAFTQLQESLSFGYEIPFNVDLSYFNVHVVYMYRFIHEVKGGGGGKK